ncbi:retrovirus-related pol polyprotein from transposon TNT 1-94 [Tanacetum coccineum]
MNMDQDRQILMVDDNVGNQFRQNAVQNVGNLVGQNAVQNQGIQNIRNQNGLSIISRIANQHGNGNVIVARAEGNGNRINGNQIRCYNCQGEGHYASNCTDEIEEVNSNCTLKDNLQQASTSGTQTDNASIYDSGGSTELLEPIPEPHQVQQNDSNVISEVSKAAKFVRDFKSLAKEADESLAQHKDLELKIERLLRAVVSQDIMSIMQSNSVVDTSNLQTELEPYNDMRKYDKISYDKAYNDMQQKINRMQAQLGDQKGKSKDTQCVSDTLDPLPQKLENDNVELEFQVQNYEKENAHLKTAYKNLFDSINVTQAQTKTIIDSLQTKLHDTIYENAKLLFNKVSKQKDTTKGTSVNTLFYRQLILGKPHSSRSKLYSVTPFPKSKGLPKIDESHALSKPVTSNLVPTPTESKFMKNDNMISSGIFRINHFKASRVDNFVPNKHVKASVRTKPITVSQPHVITKNDVNSKTNGFSPRDVKSTTRTRLPRSRNNPKNDKVPSKSKSS